jgi:hypothetical protein
VSSSHSQTELLMDRRTHIRYHLNWDIPRVKENIVIYDDDNNKVELFLVKQDLWLYCSGRFSPSQYGKFHKIFSMSPLES